jgi:hypothetical protein
MNHRDAETWRMKEQKMKVKKIFVLLFRLCACASLW